MVNSVIKSKHNVELYLDDLVIYSVSWSEHIKQTDTLFNRLSCANLTVNLGKCEFGRATVTYLGNIVCGGQVHPVEFINFSMPNMRHKLCRFLGMVGLVLQNSLCKF